MVSAIEEHDGALYFPAKSSALSTLLNDERLALELAFAVNSPEHIHRLSTLKLTSSLDQLKTYSEQVQR